MATPNNNKNNIDGNSAKNKKRAPREFKWLPEHRRILLEEYARFPILWDKFNQNYMNIILCEAALDDVEHVCNAMCIFL